MYRTVFVRHRRRAIAGIAVLAAAGAVSGEALASSPYSVVVTTMPGVLHKGQLMDIIATGHSSNASRLTVFVDPLPCASLATVEVTHPKALKVISHIVVNNFTRVRTRHATVIGVHHVCAYLTALPPKAPLKLQYATDTTSFKVVAG